LKVQWKIEQWIFVNCGVVRATATPNMIDTNPPAEIEQRV
jgi:hypothetical protein